MTGSAVPVGYHAITAALAFQDPAAAIDFYKRAFGATEVLRLTAADRSILHAELKIAGGMIMLSPEDSQYNATPATLGGTTVVLHLYVPDADAFAQRAVEAGARLVIPIADQFYGDRSGRLEDPFGYLWVVATRKEVLSAEDMQRRFDDMMRRS